MWISTTVALEIPPVVIAFGKIVLKLLFSDEKDNLLVETK